MHTPTYVDMYSTYSIHIVHVSTYLQYGTGTSRHHGAQPRLMTNKLAQNSARVAIASKATTTCAITYVHTMHSLITIFAIITVQYE